MQNALDAKQNTIPDLSTIRNGATLGATALQPNDNITELVNNAGYISGITSSDVTTALGYTPYNATNPNGFISSAAIASLTDVALTGLADGQVLKYNSTTQKWENKDIVISGGTWGSITGTLADQTDLQTALNGKQATLVSGTNIKTINNNSILGSGNLTLDGLPSQTGQSGKFLTTNGTDASWATVTIPTPTYDSTNERITW